jgi:ribosomal protein S7
MRLARRSNSFFRLNDRFFIFSYPVQLARSLMFCGNYLRALNVVREFLFRVKKIYGYSDIFGNIQRIFDKYRPLISFFNRKVAASTYSLPWFIDLNRSRSLLLRWFVSASRERSERGLVNQLLGEFSDLSKGVGRTVRKLEDYYELAKRNRPFMRFMGKRRGGKVSRLKKYGLTNVHK